MQQKGPLTDKVLIQLIHLRVNVVWITFPRQLGEKY